MKHTTDPASLRSRPAGIRTALLAGLALLSSSVLPVVAHADDSEIPDQPAVVSTELSTEGKQLLAATLLLAASLVGMERFCSWRLSVRHRADAVRPTLTECVPLVPGPSLFSPTPEV